MIARTFSEQAAGRFICQVLHFFSGMREEGTILQVELTSLYITSMVADLSARAENCYGSSLEWHAHRTGT